MSARRLIAERVIYIDPANCASRIGYRIYRGYGGILLGQISLTECNKEISWDLRLDKSTNSDLKLLLAANFLLEARYKWRVAVAAKRRKRRRKRSD